MSKNTHKSPEQAMSPNEPQICAVRCGVCGHCIAVCPQGVLAQEQGEVVVAHPELCDACLTCEEACPESAIEVSFAIVWAEPLSDASDQA